MENKYMIAKWIDSYVIYGSILFNKEVKNIMMILGFKGDYFSFFVYIHGTTVGHGSFTELKKLNEVRKPFSMNKHAQQIRYSLEH